MRLRVVYCMNTVIPNVVMLYDGLCGVCQQSVRLVKRLDRQQRIEYLDARDWLTVSARFPTLDREAILGLIHVISPDGRVTVGFEGVRSLARYLSLLRWVAPLLYLPGMTWLGSRVYGWVARNRLQISKVLGWHIDPCEDGVCRIDSPRSPHRSVNHIR